MQTFRSELQIYFWKYMFSVLFRIIYKQICAQTICLRNLLVTYYQPRVGINYFSRLLLQTAWTQISHSSMQIDISE